ncbi:DNRLRE domain-containing protein [Halogeometricum luteum]|uniref:DNRLRE domain-containing protein n=1 Tax=Halogeometricum luteum TaxID=2950537 RepID=A0ABU2G412_9EURY|nr:DNRLRE domain-containing protein [Halogeometricum sp. S3BR5-2]MDS0295018.1 DNRLRE domain-containing protein [Halogeometricum sp. S3BR5-2]
MRRLRANGSGGDPSGPTATRRTVLKAIGVGAGLAGFGASTGVAAETEEPWSVVALPDTQFYAEDMAKYPGEMTQWIADNHAEDKENIAFVSHVGDIVENADIVAEWEHMDEAMSTLDGVVPYSTLPGNHDWEVNMERSSSIANYKEYFGASRYERKEYFGGAGPTNGDPNRDDLNTYQLFSAGGYDFLHLALEWEPPGSVDDPSTPLGWAQQVLDEYPDRATILTTHSYLRDNPTARLDRVQEKKDADGNRDGNSGQTVWEELVAPNSQVFMVLCGHWYKYYAEADQVSTNEAGEEVYEMLANYQAREDAGHGLLRQIKFQPGGSESEGVPDRIQMHTFSPSTGEVETDEDSDFGFDLDFDARFGGESETVPEASFQQGVDGYGGTVDTTLYESDPMTAYGDSETMVVDTREPQDSENAAQALLRFDDVVGDADGQIPPGSTVDSATLTLECVNDGDGAALHRMRTGWDDGDTWDSVGGGVRTDDSDAASTPDAETGAVDAGTVPVDVTQSVQAWVDGDRNLGWVFEPAGGDGCDFETAESGNPPRLTVRYTASDGTGGGPVTGDADGDGDVDEEDVEAIQRSVAGEDVDIDSEAADVDGDGDVDIGDAIGARNISEENQ